jgi:transcriptional regulator with AAA-type ATPase domain
MIDDHQTVTIGADEHGEGGLVADAPLLYLALDGAKPLAPPSRHALVGVRRVHIGRGTERRVRRGYHDGDPILEVTLHDPSVSKNHAQLFIEPGGRTRLVDQGSKNGTLVDGEKIDETVLRDGACIAIGQSMLLLRGPEPVPLGGSLDLYGGSLPLPPGMATLQPALSKTFEGLAKIARSSSNVLLQGPTGTGKEMAARAVHELSSEGRFVAVNCGALTETLLEGELFGYRKGAFTGADQDREGLVPAAHGGTLFLDEVGELSPRAQATLLRVLQNREVRPLGTTEVHEVDLRLIVATHRDLLQMVESGDFREDLYARVSDFVVSLPCLAQRREDLGLLVRAVLPEVAPRAEAVKLSGTAVGALFAYHWPRNVRELEKCLSSAVVLSDGGTIAPEHLPAVVRDARYGEQQPATPSATRAAPDMPPLSQRDAVRRQQLVDLLESHQGNISRVAADLGKHRQQIQKWLKRFQIDVDRYR